MHKPVRTNHCLDYLFSVKEILVGEFLLQLTRVWGWMRAALAPMMEVAEAVVDHRYQTLKPWTKSQVLDTILQVEQREKREESREILNLNFVFLNL